MIKKFSILLFILIVIVPIKIYTQWYEVSGVINDVCYINSNTLIAVGEGGTVRMSYDYGATWVMIDTKFTWDLYSIVFVNETTGFIAGQRGVLKTTDGGQTWNICFNSESSEAFFYREDIYFINETTGFLVNFKGQIYKTTDKGSTWSRINHGLQVRTDIGYISQVFFKDENIGFMSYSSSESNSLLYYTSNGGQSWRIYDDNGGRFIQFVSNNIGYMICKTNTLLKTIDGGNNWEKLEIGISDYIYSLHFITEKIGYAVCYYGHILKTIDGGITWVIHNSKVNYTITSVTADASGNNAVAVGSNATILKNINQTIFWDLLSQSPPPTMLKKARFINDNKAIIVGPYGYMSTTDDGGATFKTKLFKSGIDILDVYFPSPQTGYLLTEEGCIYKTIDGGNNWDSLNIKNNYMGNLYFYNDNFGFTYPTEPYRTVDGGKTWEWIDYISFSDIQFLNDSCGFYLDSYDGAIFNSSDGGKIWNRWTDCTPCAYNGTQICFVSPMVGYIASGAIYKTIDGGKSWEKFQYRSLDNESCVALDFVSETEGYILTDYFYFTKLKIRLEKV